LEVLHQFYGVYGLSGELVGGLKPQILLEPLFELAEQATSEEE